MISEKIMKEFNIHTVWRCSKRDERFVLGYISAYLALCEDGKWLAIIPETPSEKSELMILNSRSTAMKRLRERGFWTRVNKIYPNFMKGI
jgi:hypothetical protein